MNIILEKLDFFFNNLLNMEEIRVGGKRLEKRIKMGEGKKAGGKGKRVHDGWLQD